MVDTDDAAERRQRAHELLWGEGQRPSRGPKPSLSLERVVTAAVAIADAEGLGAVSMQRVAADLGVTKMAMYRYVPGKAELNLLMVDAAMHPEPDMNEVDGDWRVKLGSWGGRLWERLVAHPWVLGATLGLRPLGPVELGWMNSGLEALRDTVLTGAQRLDSIQLLSGHLRALAQQTLPVPGESFIANEDQFADHIGAALREHGKRFPALAEAIMDDTGGRNQALEYGVERILDGIAVLIERRTA